MWRSLVQIPGLLQEIIQLLREQNLLLRDHHRTVTGRTSPVLPTPRSSPLPPRPVPSRRLQATDVTVVSRADRIRAQEADSDRQRRPWADPRVTSPPSQTE